MVHSNDSNRLFYQDSPSIQISQLHCSPGQNVKKVKCHNALAPGHGTLAGDSHHNYHNNGTAMRMMRHTHGIPSDKVFPQASSLCLKTYSRPTIDNKRLNWDDKTEHSNGPWSRNPSSKLACLPVINSNSISSTVIHPLTRALSHLNTPHKQSACLHTNLTTLISLVSKHRYRKLSYPPDSGPR